MINKVTRNNKNKVPGNLRIRIKNFRNHREEEMIGVVKVKVEVDQISKVKQFSYCNKLNHTMDECYSKHGYPPW